MQRLVPTGAVSKRALACIHPARGRGCLTAASRRFALRAATYVAGQSPLPHRKRCAPAGAVGRFALVATHAGMPHGFSPEARCKVAPRMHGVHGKASGDGISEPCEHAYPPHTHLKSTHAPRLACLGVLSRRSPESLGVALAETGWRRRVRAVLSTHKIWRDSLFIDTRPLPPTIARPRTAAGSAPTTVFGIL